MSPIALFDLDGTLVDSAPDLQAALNRLMVTRGLAAFTLPEVVAMVGHGAKALVQQALRARGQAFDPLALDAFLTDYGQNAAVATYAYPGIPEALVALSAAGWRMAVCTNKPAEPARRVLQALGIAARFVAIGGGDSYPVRKPDPGHVLATLRDAGAGPERAVMIGDHDNDMLAGQAAGVARVFVTWGYGPIGSAGDARIAHAPAELPGLLAEIDRGR